MGRQNNDKNMIVFFKGVCFLVIVKVLGTYQKHPVEDVSPAKRSVHADKFPAIVLALLSSTG